IYHWFFRRNFVDSSGAYHPGAVSGPLQLSANAQFVGKLVWGTRVAPIDGSGRLAFLFHDATSDPVASNGPITDGTRYRALYLTQDGQAQTSLTTLSAQVGVSMMDINGDGLADAFEIPGPSASDPDAPVAATRVFPNTGAGFAAPIQAMWNAVSQNVN